MRKGGAPLAGPLWGGQPESFPLPQPSPAEPATMALSFLLCLERVSERPVREAGPNSQADPNPGLGRGTHSHSPVVPVHEDEEHGCQEEEDGQDDDCHLWGQKAWLECAGHGSHGRDGGALLVTCRTDMSSGSRMEMAGCTSSTL